MQETVQLESMNVEEGDMFGNKLLLSNRETPESVKRED